MRVHFACFHVGLKSPDLYMDMVAMMAASVRRSHPDGRVVLLTDDRTVIPPGVADAVVRAPGVNPMELMFDRVQVERAYMRSPLFDHPTVFLDSDVLVNQSLDSVFREPFDVGLTWRREIPGQPYNGGVKFAVPGPGSLKFWDANLFLQARMDDKRRRWWGDQIAMHETVGIPEEELGRRTHAVVEDDIRVRLFPCETHNYSPPVDRPPPKKLNGRLLLHFKGDRKPMMKDYAERCLGLSVAPLPEAA